MSGSAIEPPSDSRHIDVGRESGEIICHALGIEPNMCRAVDIRWRPGEIPYAEVELYLNERAVFEIIRLRPERNADVRD
jgi:hypothetical protein